MTGFHQGATTPKRLIQLACTDKLICKKEYTVVMYTLDRTTLLYMYISYNIESPLLYEIATVLAGIDREKQKIWCCNTNFSLASLSSITRLQTFTNCKQEKPFC